MGDTIQAGEVIGRRYTLLRTLGLGGFGQVWLAHDEDLNVKVALKQVRLPGPTAPEEQRHRIARAVREAQHAARLRDHPSIVTVHDALEHDGSPWIVMQYVEGRSLAEELRQHGRLPVDQVARIAEAMLAALAAAHKADIMHRDVKPANVLLAAEGQVLLTDFGIAVTPTDATLTASGMVIGSPGYVAPERLQGTKPGAAADLFALGVTLYEAVEGEPPFTRQNPVAALTQEPRPPLHAGRLGPLLLRLLEKAPAQRPDATAARAMLRADPDTSDTPTKVITTARTPEKAPERPVSGEPAAITSGRMETVKARGTQLAEICGALAGIPMAILAPLLVLYSHLRVGNTGVVWSIVIIIAGGYFFGYVLGWVQGTWTGLFGDLASLTVSPGGITVTGQTSAEYKWDDLKAVKLERSGGTVTLIVTVRPERASDTEWQMRHLALVDKEGKAEVFVGHGIPTRDAGRVMAALSHYAGNLYSGPSSLL
ncbi:serine/threonine-protein kinase [Streptomyces sp. RTGN2]|uniref:serine/threonine-protein kinase n=1 Tax=Streptomyces sp. RTGN2 TaxID=3016525 RepID=UPI002556C442|nr:serine/threonine-protein kinase [Streptomyces sp. RTGN2]